MTELSPHATPPRAEDSGILDLPRVTRAEDRVVLKIGTTSLVTDGALDPDKLDRLCEAVQIGRASCRERVCELV